MSLKKRSATDQIDPSNTKKRRLNSNWITKESENVFTINLALFGNGQIRTINTQRNYPAILNCIIPFLISDLSSLVLEYLNLDQKSKHIYTHKIKARNEIVYRGVKCCPSFYDPSKLEEGFMWIPVGWLDKNKMILDSNAFIGKNEAKCYDSFSMGVDCPSVVPSEDLEFEYIFHRNHVYGICPEHSDDRAKHYISECCLCDDSIEDNYSNDSFEYNDAEKELNQSKRDDFDDWLEDTTQNMINSNWSDSKFKLCKSCCIKLYKTNPKSQTDIVKYLKENVVSTFRENYLLFVDC
jgi:hypothetical protein